MPAIKHQDIAYRIGTQADRTTVAASLTDFVPPADGIGLAPSQEMVELDTDHGMPGEKYSDLGARNTAELSGSTYLYPQSMGIFLDAVFKRDTNGDLTYHTLERWFKKSTGGSVLGGTEDKGERYFGSLFNGLGLTLARSQRNEAIMAELRYFINAKRRIEDAESAPTYDQSKVFPYGSAGMLVDFVRNESDSYGADDPDVRSVAINFSNNSVLDGVQDNLTDAPLHRSWLYHFAGNPSADVTVVVRLTQDEYLRIDEFVNLPKGKLRIALNHPRAGSITSTSTLSSGNTGNQVLLVSDTTAFLVGDIVCITHPTTGFAITKVTAISAGVSLTVSGYDTRVTLNGAVGGPLTIRNMAAGIIIDEMHFNGRGSTKREGVFQTLELKYKAKLLAGSTFPLDYAAYNHANSRIS